MRWNLAKRPVVTEIPSEDLPPSEYIKGLVEHHVSEATLKFFNPLAEKVVALEKRLVYCEKRLGINKDQRNCPRCGKLEHRKDSNNCGVCGAKL